MDDKETPAAPASAPPPASEEVKAAPAPKAAPKISITERANAELAATKTGFSPLKPFRYGIAFTRGMVGEGFNGFAKWGRKGLIVGLATGAVVAIGAPWIAGTALFGGAIGGFLVGALGGGAHGLATGGTRAVGRLQRAEKYAEDLIVRSEIQRNARPNRADYRHNAIAARAEDRRQKFEDQRQFMERINEIERDARTYGTVPTHSSNASWVERITNSHENPTRGHEL